MHPADLPLPSVFEVAEDMNQDGDFLDVGDVPPEEGCLAGSCLDGMDNDNDGKQDLADGSCSSNLAQAWSDLYFEADIPAGTSISFDVCTGESTTDLMSGCTYAHVATVTSSSGGCATDSECANIVVGGTTRTGFCGAGGQCQFVTPQKRADQCSSQADCLVGTRNGEWESSFCNASNQCQYTTPPGDVAEALDAIAGNGLPYAQVRVTLNANTSGSAAPTLLSWYMTYNCTGAN